MSNNDEKERLFQKGMRLACLEQENASLKRRCEKMAEALEQISCYTYSSFPLSTKELCNNMASIAKQALELYRKMKEGK